MSQIRGAAKRAPSGAVRFDERLSVPWWWWPSPLIVIGLLEISVLLGHPEVPWWIPAALLLPLAAWWLVRLGRTRVTLTEAGDGEQVLRVGPATLPTRFVTEARAVAPAEKRVQLGPELDPSAYLVHRAWIGPMVRLTLDDPADPTPYWLFSVRRAEALVKCLRTGASD